MRNIATRQRRDQTHWRRLLTLLLSLLLLGGGGVSRQPALVAAASIVVSNTNDSGDGSLRAAITQANASPGADTIIFASSVTDTITLTDNLPTISESLTITGPGLSSLTINRNDLSPGTTLFTVTGGSTTVALRVSGLTLSGASKGLHLTNANSTATLSTSTINGNNVGVWLDRARNVTIDNSTISNNTLGVVIIAGEVQLTNATISKNTTAGLDFVDAGDATVLNTTLEGNDSGLLFEGGGKATITNSTISKNTTAGVVKSGGGQIMLTNSLLATAPLGVNCVGGSLEDGGNNLLDDEFCGLTNGSNGNQIVTAGGTGLDPAGPGNNGGPTQTIALLPTSPAVDAGNQSNCAAAPINNLDQRGVSRLQGTACDIGAYELAQNSLAITTTGNGRVNRSLAGRGSGPFYYLPGTSVRLTAAAAPGYRLSGWTLDGAPTGSTTPLALTMNGNHSVEAIFVCIPTSFADVPANYWATCQINQMAVRTITKGCTTATYCPEANVTRAEMAVFIVRALGTQNPPKPTKQTFGDVPSTYWAAAFIEQFATLGITKGCGDGTNFCPNDPVTRAEMAAFLTRAKVKTELRPATPSFSDVPTDYWAYGWIEQFKTLGVTKGCGDGSTYCPNNNVTRAEMAVFIVRAWP